MKKQNRKGFTIVELVIVIAVIAVLSAVLIPTFGGIIKAANISADKQMAASLTVALNADLDGIKDHDELYALIAETFDQETADNLAPKSAQYGYHYWYDAKTNRVELSTYEDLDAIITSTANLEQTDAQSGAAVMSAVTVSSTFTPFEPNSHRSLHDGRFFIIDKGGEIGTILKAVDEGDTSKVSSLNSFEESNPNYNLALILLNRFGAVAKVDSFVISASGAGTKDSASIVYVPYDAKTLTLTAKDFLDENGVKLANKTVTWSVPEGSPVTVDPTTGVVTIDVLPEISRQMAVTVTATVDNDGKTETKEIRIVRIDSANVSTNISEIGSIKLSDTSDKKEEELTVYPIYYTGSANQIAYSIGAITPNLNWSSSNVACDATVTITTSGDAFSIENGNLTLTGKPDKQKVTVTIGNISVDGSDTHYIVSEFYVEVIDNSKTAFTNKPIVDINNDGIYDKDDGDTMMGEDYLFRVGNGNAVALENFFNNTKAADNIVIQVYDRVASSEDVLIGVTDFKASISNATPITKTLENGTEVTIGWKLSSENWKTSTIKFTGTGIAKIRIGNMIDESNYKYDGFAELVVEVVDGKNVLTYSDLAGSNNILLNDIVMSDGGYNFLSGNFYGNGYTFDISKGTNASANYGILIASNATFDNIRIVGATYTTHTNSTGGDHAYSSSAIIFSGTSEIVNSYVYGCRAPIRLNSGTLTIKNTILEGGRYANIDLRQGNLVLNNAITISTSSLGIVIDGSCTGANISGTVKQYNWMCMDDQSKLPSDYQSLIGEMFKNPDYRHDYDEVPYVNTGIVALNEESNTVINTVDVSGYTEFAVSYSGFTRQLWTLPDDTYDVTAEDIKYRDNDYPYNRNQGNTKPTYEWKYPAEYESGKIILSVEKDETIEFNPHGILTATKYGKTLDISVSINNTVYTGNISFPGTATATYTLTYTITDDVIYNASGDSIKDKSFTYTKTLDVQVNVVDTSADAPTFTFYYGTKGSKGGEPYDSQPSNALVGTVVEVGGVKYVSAVSSSNANIGSTTVNGQTIYYPIVDGMIEKGGSDGTDFRRYYPIFKGVTISDNGTEYSFNKTKEMPESLIWDSYTSTGGNSYGDAPQADTLLFKDKLCRAMPSFGNTESGGTFLVKYRYTGADGNEYVYYVQYKYYDEDESCVVEGTMITMADGTQKAVEDLVVGDMIMAFNHVTGKYEAMPLIFNTHSDETEASDRQVLTLEFSNNSNLKIVAAHGLFDMTLMKYVYITNENYQDYIGHEFYALNSDGTGGERVELVNAFIQTEHVRVYCPVTYFHMNSFANGLLNTPNIPGDITGLVNYFEYDADLKYNEEAMQRDIEKYGLYTYEDFSDYISEAAYNSSPSVYLKVAVGKGMITYEQIIDVINYLLAGSLID